MCFHPFSKGHEVLADTIFGTGYYIMNSDGKETDSVKVKLLHSDGSLLSKSKRKWKEVKKTFLYGFGFRDGQNPWLNFCFAYTDKLGPDCEV